MFLVPFHIPMNFPFPIITVRGWHPATRAIVPVPEAAVYKNREVAAGENNIRIAG
jgi:hypothetical protein